MTVRLTELQPPSRIAEAPRRNRGGFIAGLLAGAAVVASGWVVAARIHHRAELTSVPYEVSRDTVNLHPGARSGPSFETVQAEVSEPLPHPPYTGRVASIETMTSPCFAPLPGRVTDVRVRIGAIVKQGDRLVEVRTTDLASMQHELRAARLAVRTKQAVVDRLSQMVELRAASTHDLLVAQSELDESKFSVQAADARLRALMVAQSGETNYWILAPRAGVVVQLDASAGKQVGPTSDKPVATISDLEEVLILADVHQTDAANLKSGIVASVTIPGSITQTTEATIETVSDVVDPARQTVPVRLRSNNVGHVLRPNAYVEVTFSPGRDRILQVPAAAVVTDGEAAVVFVEEEPGKLRRRSVQLGRQTKERVEVLSGLKAGEKVVTRGALLLLNAVNTQG